MKDVFDKLADAQKSATEAEQASREAVELLTAAQRVADRYVQEARDVADAYKRRVYTEMSNLMVKTQRKATEMMQGAEGPEKETGAAIIENAHKQAHKLEEEAKQTISDAREASRRILAEAVGEAEKIVQRAKEAAEATNQEANHKLVLAEDRANEILARAREKGEKNIESAKKEYDKIRGMIEHSLQIYRRINEQIKSLEAEDLEG